MNALHSYGDEIGAVTPAVRRFVAAAVQRYSEEWVVKAIEECAKHEQRRWAYAEAILERWESAGGIGSPRRHERERHHGALDHLIVRSEADVERLARDYPDSIHARGRRERE